MATTYNILTGVQKNQYLFFLSNFFWMLNSLHFSFPLRLFDQRVPFTFQQALNKCLNSEVILPLFQFFILSYFIVFLLVCHGESDFCTLDEEELFILSYQHKPNGQLFVGIYYKRNRILTQLLIMEPFRRKERL